MRPRAVAVLVTTISLLCAGWFVGCSSACDGATSAHRGELDIAEQGGRPFPPENTREVDGASATGGDRRALVGYEVPGELLRIRSKHLPEGVVAVTLPPDYERSATKTYPLVIAFGGAGECAREPSSGALAWMRYYKADEALLALKRGHLRADDFRGLTTPAQLGAFNKRLKARPFEGVILACPSSPLISQEFPLDSPRYEAFLMDDVIPRLLESYRVTEGRIGVDGVSMGGARAMYYGLKHPEVFASIGAVQGAFGRAMETYRLLLRQNRSTLSKRSIQLVTSDRDGLAPAVARMHELLTANQISHRYVMLTGPHDYVFNQGPGVISLLMFHDEVLRE